MRKSPKPSEESSTSDEKTAAIRRAAQHEFPAADIEVMLAEIERGYESDANPKID